MSTVDGAPSSSPPNSGPALDPVIRKKVLRMISYGMYVITARSADRIAAATIDWVTQASFEPPMVVCCLRRDSLIYDLVIHGRTYAIHPLGEDQKPFAMHFFKNRETTSSHINGQSYRLNTHGVPLLCEAPAHLVLQVCDKLPQGDHAVILGRVISADLIRETPPLLLRDTGWHYGG